MSKNTTITDAFQGWKMWLGVFIGLTVVVWMLYKSITAISYIEVLDGSGNYEWVDSNNNQRVDLHLSNEFKPLANGTYRQQTVADTLQHIHWTVYSIFWLLLALVFVVGRDFFYMLRIRLLTHRILKWKSCFNVIMLWEFASALAPGVMSGASVAMFILHREKIELGKATAIIFVTAMMDNLFFVMMIPIIFLFMDTGDVFPGNLSVSSGAQTVFWIGYFIIISICLFMFFSLFVFPHLVSRVLNSIFSLPFLRRWKEGALRTGKDLELSSRELKKEPALFWLKVFASTFGSWISRYLVINALLQAFLHLRVFDHVMILGKQFVLWLFMRMSPTPGGSGVAEYAFGELLSPFSQSALLLVGLAILWRLISYFPYLFIGVYLLPKWLKKKI